MGISDIIFSGTFNICCDIRPTSMLLNFGIHITW